MTENKSPILAAGVLSQYLNTAKSFEAIGSTTYGVKCGQWLKYAQAHPEKDIVVVQRDGHRPTNTPVNSVTGIILHKKSPLASAIKFDDLNVLEITGSAKFFFKDPDAQPPARYRDLILIRNKDPRFFDFSHKAQLNEGIVKGTIPLWTSIDKKTGPYVQACDKWGEEPQPSVPKSDSRTLFGLTYADQHEDLDIPVTVKMSYLVSPAHRFTLAAEGVNAKTSPKEITEIFAKLHVPLHSALDPSTNTILPSLEEKDEKGRLVYRSYHCEGNLCNPATYVPAKQHFDPERGVIIEAMTADGENLDKDEIAKLNCRLGFVDLAQVEEFLNAHRIINAVPAFNR